MITDDGLNRIRDMFLEDIAKVTYTVDGVAKEKQIYNSKLENNKVTIFFQIPTDENGTFDNFELLSKTGIVYSNKILNFRKDSDTIILEFPYLIKIGS